jgi:hypothetical protein
LSFEANQGQTASAVQFFSRGSGYALFLTPQEAVLSLSKPVTPTARGAAVQPAQQTDVLRMQLVGANPSPQVAGVDQLPGTTNYFLGNNPAQWRTNVPTYGKVAYQDVYPGIDLVYYGNQQQLEYDFVVQPGASPDVIRLSVQGAQNMSLDAQGNLVLQTANGDVVEQAPVVYQEGAGGRQAVAGRYVLVGQDGVGFQVGGYDGSRPLVIDPLLSYSTYLGGGDQDYGYGIAVDPSGNAYATGNTYSSNFPTTPEALQTTYGGYDDAFVAKLNATGTALLYSTYLGGSGADAGSAIAVDTSGNAYVTGLTWSYNLPTTPGAFQTTLEGSGYNDAFVAKLNAMGTALLYATYLGGNNSDVGYGIAVDISGNVYVTGETLSSVFPITPGAPQTTYGGGFSDAFVAKFVFATVTTVLPSVNSSVYGQLVTFTASVTCGGIPLSTGTVTFQEGNTVLASGVPVNSGGQASFQISTLTAAYSPHTITAYYSDSTGSNPSSGSIIQAVNKAPLSVVAANTSRLYGAANPTFTGAIAGIQNYDPITATYSTVATPASNVGTYAIVPTLSDGGSGKLANYTVTSTNGTLTVTPALLTVTAANASRLYGAANPTFTGTITGIKNGDQITASYSTTATLTSPVGTYAITATLLDPSNKLGNYTVTVHNGTLTVKPAPLTVTPANASREFGTPNPVFTGTITGIKNGDQITASYSTTATLTSPAGTYPITATLNDPTNKLGNYRVTVKQGTLTITPAASSFVVSGFPSPITAGVAGSVLVTATDAAGQIVTGYRGMIHFTSSDPHAVLPADYTFTAADNGAHAFVITLKKAGTQSITARDTLLPNATGTQTGIVVKAAAARKFIVAGYPSPTVAGAAHTFTVTAKDAFGNTATGYRGTVHFTSSDSKAALPQDYTFTATDNGVHRFSATFKTVGTQSLSVTDTKTSTITGTQTSIQATSSTQPTPGGGYADWPTGCGGLLVGTEESNASERAIPVCLASFGIFAEDGSEAASDWSGTLLRGSDPSWLRRAVDVLFTRWHRLALPAAEGALTGWDAGDTTIV